MERKVVLARDSFEGCPCCIYCGHPEIDGKGLHLHHVKRRSQGGSDDERNLVTLCYKCHTELHAGNRKIQEYCERYLERKYE